ncbi:hypothetical protein [Gluconobacter sp. OJB]|uniref:hypothetical protein n=1 Tax=Gluconobacter sp. OJB TaxID=3145196 RepID=UPI0031F798C7
MFSLPKYIISCLDGFETKHVGSVAIITGAVSLIAISKSILNTWSLHQQANLQRKIENSRYILNLFNVSNNAYNEFLANSASSVLNNDEKDFPIYGNKELISALRKTEQCIFIFNPEENSPLHLCKTDLKGAIDCLLQIFAIEKEIEEAEKGDLEYKEPIDKLIHLKTLREEIEEYKEIYYRTGAEYSGSFDCAIQYMEERLFVPRIDVFAKEPWLFVTWYRWAKTLKTNRPVMFWLGAVCVLALSVLLCW